MPRSSTTSASTKKTRTASGKRKTKRGGATQSRATKTRTSKSRTTKSGTKSRTSTRSAKSSTSRKQTGKSAASAKSTSSESTTSSSTTSKSRTRRTASANGTSAKRATGTSRGGAAARRNGATRGNGTVRRNGTARRNGRAVSPNFRTYQSALQYLRTRTNYEMLVKYDYNNRNFNLSRMNRLLAALDNPHQTFKSVHVAGTKGKGSTVAMASAMLNNCGYKVGSYTSPHLITLRERMAIDGVNPNEQEFTRVLSKVAVVIAKTFPENGHPTFFETLTAAAFLWFAENDVEVAVVETGLGGRLDATNVLSPEVCGITNISYDHMGLLGDTVEQIAAEKAGIIKEGIPVVSAPQTEKVLKVLRDAAAAKNAPFSIPGEDNEFSFRFEANRDLGPHTRLSLTTGRSRFEHLHVPLPGEHQAINCSVALSMMDLLKTRGFKIDDQKAIEGLGNTRISGRMEMVSEEPRVMVDGAHNASSVEALMRAIGQTVNYDSMVVIFACQRDKDVAGMLRHVQLGADKIIFTSSNMSRSMDPEDLLMMFQERCSKMAQVAPTLDDAMEIARSATTRGDLICITGSFYIVGKAKRLFGKLD